MGRNSTVVLGSVPPCHRRLAPMMFWKPLILVASVLATGCSGGGSGSGSFPPAAPATPVAPAAPASPNDPEAPTAPAIRTAPANQTAVVGGSATFSITCAGSGLSYLWQDAGGTTLGTAAACTMESVALADDGKVISVTVTNAGGSVKAQASLRVVANGTAPVILVEPLDGTFLQGNWAQFSVMAEGAPTPQIQWFRNGSPIDGATDTLCGFLVQDASMEGAAVHAVVTNPAGRVATREAVLHVTSADAPFFEIQPGSVTAYAGTQAAFGTSTAAPSSIVWVVDGTTLPAGRTQATFGGEPTTFAVTPDPQGLSSCLAFLAPAAPGTHTVQAIATASGIPTASNPVTLTVAPRTTKDPVFTIQNILLDQGIQREDGSVPPVAGRAGLLRVACEASAFNTLTPGASITVTVPGQTPVSYAVPAPAKGVPTSADLKTCPSTTWDVMLPASLIQPDTTIAVVLDPGGQNVSAPAWTIHATPVPDLDIEFIPMVLAGGTPTITADEVQAVVQAITRLHPLARIVATVGAPFTPSIFDISTAENVNQVLLDLETKRIADGELQTYYQGVWQAGVTCSYAGLALIGSPDSPANRSSLVVVGAPITSAHELGHNLGLQHAPCGSVMSPDPDYPYPEGLIGPGQPVDITGPGLLPVDPQQQLYHDLMGYCGQFWISDYNYIKEFEALTRQEAPGNPSGVAASIVVSGVQGAGGWNLRPAFTLTTRPTAPAKDGARIDLLNGDTVVASQMVALSDAEETGRAHFIAAIPMPRVPFTAIRLTREGRSTILTGLRGQEEAPSLVAMGPRTAHLSWNHAVHSAALVRDEVTGKVVAMAAGDSQEVPVVPGHTYRVDLSHNLGTESHRGVVLANAADTYH